VTIAGRVLLKRKLGRIGFATLRDGSGDLQVLVSREAVGTELFDLWQHDIDLGDHVSVTGEVITTRNGELSVSATSLILTSNSLRPPPDKHKGLTDPATGPRRRERARSRPTSTPTTSICTCGSRPSCTSSD
jgi:lysyl-tRNA synthetase class 2